MFKKLSYLYSIILILVALPLVAHAQVENLLLNPSFEEDEEILDDPNWIQWITWGYESGLDSIVEIDQTTSIDGARSLRIEPTGNVNWYFVVLFEPILLDVGQDYTVSFWAKAEETRPLVAQMKAIDNSSAWGFTEYELTTEWAEYTFTASALNADAKLEFWCSGDDVILWLDYVYVYEGEYVATNKPSGADKSSNPNPEDGAIDVPREIILDWTPGKSAETHELYFGTDFNDVNSADVNDTTGIYRGSMDLDVTSYTPEESPLQWNQTYYWRVDEVNDAEPNSPWKGKIWSFTTTNFIIVEDFENYSDYPPDEVWNTWIDGYGNSANGSTAGYPAPDFVLGEHYLEDEIVHSGDWSMPLYYSNGLSGISEVMRTLTSVRNWTRDDIITFTLFYKGNLGNAAEPMFVALNGDAVITNENPRTALESDWTRWDILLQDFADLGVDLTDVETLSIGFGNKAGPTPGGGKGHVFIDDIRLYRSLPVEQEPELEPVDPGTDNLVASYSFENNVQDNSGNGLNGTIIGNPTFIEGIAGMGLSFDGVNDYVDFGNNEAFNITEQITLSAWINTNDSGNGQDNPYVSKGDHAYAIKHSYANQMQFFIYDGDWFAADARVNDSFNGEWHHVAGTYNGMELKAYVDGKLASTTAHEGSIEVQPNNLNIARNSEETDRYYDGVIDEVKIYNRALSQLEISFLVAN
jgi:hypothetical protein